MVRVALVRGEDPLEATYKALDLINANMFFSSDDKVLIKPNYIVANKPEYGEVTDPKVVEAVSTYLLNHGVHNITIGEGGLGSDTADRAFKLLGLVDFAAKYGFKLVNLNLDDYVEVNLPNALRLKSIRIAKTALSCNAIVSIPKLKVHRLATVTLSVKNLMGTLHDKGVMHSHIHEKLIDLFRVLKPRLAVVDGIIAGEGGEIGSIPVKIGVIIAGNDLIAVDAVSAAIMGFNPMSIEYIRKAHEMGLGIGDLNSIEIVGGSISEVKRRFRIGGLSFSSISRSIREKL
ncbi:MAG: DUF362 domain-containing protein [Candidatus Methanomethylicia archaeon]